MKYALHTIGYFFSWGMFYGLALGTWSGTAIFPVLGTAYAGGWGIGIGAACGVLTGLLVAIVQALTFHPDMDLGRFRRRLMLGVGIFVPITAAVLLIATSEGTLWDRGIVDRAAHGAPFLGLCLIAATLWSSLSAAYVAAAYPDWLIHLKTTQNLEMVEWPSRQYPVTRTMILLFEQGLSWWLMAFGAVVGIILHHSVWRMAPAKFIEGAVVGAIVSVVLMMLISFGNAALLSFLRKTIFAEDVLPVSPRKQRWLFTGIAFVFTGLTSFWTLIFAPLCAILMALYVYRAFPRLDEDSTEKAKRKEKHALALSEESETAATHLLEEAALIEAQQR